MTTAQVLISALTVLLSVIGASFAAGIKIGSMEMTLRSISDRLTRIEALFELRIKGPSDK